jgi:hypothetical protein
MKKSGGREFFEVFRRVPEDKSRTWWSKSEQKPSSDQTTTPLQAVKEPAPTAKLEPVKNTPYRADTTTPPGRLTLTFSHEALVICVVVLAGLVVGAFVLGYARGRSNQMAAMETPPARASAQAPTPAATPSAPVAAATRTSNALVVAKPTTGAYYTLKLLDDLNVQRAQEIVADLRAMGYEDAHALQNRGKCSVNIGHFADYRGPDAKALKDRMSLMSYKGRRWFKDCSWQKVPGSN